MAQKKGKKYGETFQPRFNCACQHANVITLEKQMKDLNQISNDDLVWLNITSSWQEILVLLSK